MTELQLKTVNLTPAKIEFNKKAILDELDQTLSKYKNLVFSEDNTAEIRRTLADLRKGKTAADKFRLANKKKAIEPVTVFENEVKEIVKKFDDVINPINDQLKEFEENRRAEKLAELEKIRSEHIETHALNEEYHDKVEISDHMLTKGVSLNQAGESLEFIVKNLKMEQDKKQADKQLIETTVKLANAENELGFSADAYVRLLDFKDVEVVKNQIEADVKKEVENRRLKKEAEERAEQERLEREKQAELERIAHKKQGEHNQVSSVSVSVDDLPFTDKESQEELHPITEEVFDEIFSVDNELPFDDKPKLTKTYEVIGTDEELTEIEMKLVELGLEWDIIER